MIGGGSACRTLSLGGGTGTEASSSQVEAPKVKTTQVVTGKQWMAASDAPWASVTAHQIFSEGGNIVDAAVAASLVGGVEHPQSTGMGGGGFFVFYSVKDKKTYAWDFRERAPGAIRAELFAGKKNASLKGGLAVAVPGLIAGLHQIHSKFGKLKWKQVVEPARKLAADGVLIDSLLASGIQKLTKDREVKDIPDTAFRATFFFKGQGLQEGDLLRQPALAKTFEKIAREGVRGFYEGSVASAIVKSVRVRGGVLSLQDLKKYKVKEVEPIEIHYGNQVLKSMPIPSSGGILLGEMLGMLSQVKGFSNWKPESVLYSHYLLEVMRRAYRDRALYVGDVPLKVSAFFEPDYWKAQVASIEREHASAPESLQVFPLPPPAPPAGLPKSESKQTTHYSFMDAEGNAVATTQTINTVFGSEVIAAGTGILLNNEIDDFAIGSTPNHYGLTASQANQIAPGKTPLSSMTPTLVFEGDRVVGSIGAPGGSQIPTTVLQEYLRFFVHKMSPDEAFALPRLHQQYNDKSLIEPFGGNRSARLKEQLESLGHSFKSEMAWTRISLVMRASDGQLTGIADPRASGQAAGK